MPEATNGSFIPVPTANNYIRKFIDDYFSTGLVPTKSMILDAALLRDYLNGNPAIVNLKLVLGAKDVNGTQALTLIIAGYDDEGNYILGPENSVMDNVVPCPPGCVTVGNASNDFIIPNNDGAITTG